MSRFQAVRRETRWHGGQVPYAYRPRDYLKQPRFFGRKIDAEWKPFGDDSTERARVAAAYWQHLAACETLRIAGERGMLVDVSGLGLPDLGTVRVIEWHDDEIIGVGWAIMQTDLIDPSYRPDFIRACSKMDGIFESGEPGFQYSTY